MKRESKRIPALKIQLLFFFFGKKVTQDELLLSCPSLHLLLLLRSPALYVPSGLITDSFPSSHCPDPSAPAPPPASLSTPPPPSAPSHLLFLSTLPVSVHVTPDPYMWHHSRCLSGESNRADSGVISVSEPLNELLFPSRNGGGMQGGMGGGTTKHVRLSVWSSVVLLISLSSVMVPAPPDRSALLMSHAAESRW